MTMETQRPRILLVDDDRLILATLTMGLEKAGFDTLHAESGEDAVNICQKQRPDLIVMDIRMSGISGIEAAQRIHALFEVPVIYLSAYDDVEIVEQAVKQGGIGYMVKPVEVHQLVPEIRSVLARAADIGQLKNTEAQLSRALGAERTTSIAIGILMERRKMSASDALELLRAQARPNRRKMVEIAKEIISSIEAGDRPK